MLRFKTQPDIVFQAILRESLKYSINVISDVLQIYNHDDIVAKQELMRLLPEITRVFPPSLAKGTLGVLQRCLDTPLTYDCTQYHYLLLYDVLNFYIDVHNGMVMKSKNKKERKEASFVEPFYIEKINADELIYLYFFDEDFLFDAESVLDLPDSFRQALEPEIFGLSHGLLPHPDELELKITGDTDHKHYCITASELFGAKSREYPDYTYYTRNHSE